MLNKVVHTLCRAMNELGMPAVRFNFRGVGASEGRFADGAGEAQDAQAVCAWARARYPGAALWLGGFSFGAMVACRAAVDARPAGLVTVAPPAARTRDLLAGGRPAGPWRIVQGEADDVVSPAELREWVATLVPPPALVMLPGVDHFFHGHLTVLRENVLRWAALPAA
jgi:alpha/beta superfamily hydrolase